MYNERNLFFRPQAFIVEFEDSVHRAFDNVRSDIPIVGCNIHLGQSWYWMLQNSGFSIDYKENSNEVGQFLNHLFNFPFLRPEKLDDCFNFMSIQPKNVNVEKFCNYLIFTYTLVEIKNATLDSYEKKFQLQIAITLLFLQIHVQIFFHLKV